MLSSSRWSKTTTITRSLGPSGWALGSLINLPTIHVSQLLAVCHFLRNPSPARHTMTATRRAPSLPELRQAAWCHCAKPTVMLCGRENSIVHQHSVSKSDFLARQIMVLFRRFFVDLIEGPGTARSCSQERPARAGEQWASRV
jgi:hypothetical protein